MDKSLKKMRREYKQSRLSERNIGNDPNKLLIKWLKAALKAGEIEPNAMCLSTCKNNRPTSRIVLLRGIRNNGFTFFTNYQSEKGKQLQSNKNASLLFYWGTITRQVRIEGSIKKLSAKDSDRYFASRPRGAQISAALSRQSSAVKDRQTLEKKYRELIVKYTSDEIPRPKNWGGYLVIPNKFEFWQGREHRLHDRIVFKRVGRAWKISRLYP